jgi:hypothetical protein
MITKTITLRPEVSQLRIAEERPVKPLTAEQIRRLYHDPDATVPEHTLDDLVQGMRHFYGFKSE